MPEALSERIARLRSSAVPEAVESSPVPIHEVPDAPTRISRLREAAKGRAAFDPRSIYPALTIQDVAEGEQYGNSARGANVDRTNFPVVGLKFSFDDDLAFEKARIAHSVGKATREQQIELFRADLESQRPQSFLAGFGEMAADSLTVGAEIALGAVTGGATAGVATARLAAGVGFSAAKTQLLKQAAVGVGTAVGAAGVRELGPRIIGEGGASSAAALRRALPDLQVTDEEAANLAELSDRHFAEKFLPMIFEEHPLWKGIAEDTLSMGVETVGGKLIGKLTPMQAFRGVHADALRRAGVRNYDDALRFLENKVGMSDGLTELGEEILEGAVVEGVFGEGSMGERLTAGIPSTFTEAAQIMLLGSVAPATASALQAGFSARDKARERKLADTQAAQQSNPAAAGGNGDSSEGGDPISGGEATAETAGVEPSVSVGDTVELVDYDIEGEVAEVIEVNPKYTPEGTISVRLLDGGDIFLKPGEYRGGVELRDVEPTEDAIGANLVVAEGEHAGQVVDVQSLDGDTFTVEINRTGETVQIPASSLRQRFAPDAKNYDDAGYRTDVSQAAVDNFAGRAGLEGARATMPRNEKQARAMQFAELVGRDAILVEGEGTSKLGGMVDETGRMFIDADSASPLSYTVHELGHLVADTLGEVEWRNTLNQIEKKAPGLLKRAEASYARTFRAQFGVDPAENILEEEGFTSAAESMAPLIAHAMTPEGRADLEVIAESSPSLFRRIVDAVKRLVGRLKDTDRLAALKRIEETAGATPSKAGADLSLFLADLYRDRLDTSEGGAAAVRDEAAAPSESRFAPAPPVESEAFKAWFGDSKVVDGDGKPLVVYHGTRDGFTEFDADRIAKRFPSSSGFYFTASARKASMYADSVENAAVDWDPARKFAVPVEDSAQVLPMYLSMQNPMIVTDDAGGSGERVVDEDGGALVEKARLLGHDGVIALDAEGNIGVAVAFDPTQVKSATGNRGTFDPNDPDIRNAPGSGSASNVTEADRRSYESMATEAERIGRRRIPIIPRRPQPTTARTQPNTAQGATAAPEQPRTQRPEPQTQPQAQPSPQAEGGGAGGATVPNATASTPDAPQERRTSRNNPLPSPEQRAVLDITDAVREETGRPNIVSRASAEKHAQNELRNDYDGTRAHLERKLANGELLTNWETHAATKVLGDFALDGLRGVPGAMARAITFGDAFRTARAETARSLAATAGKGRSALARSSARGDSAMEVIIDLITTPSRKTRVELKKIHDEAQGLLRVHEPPKSDTELFFRRNGGERAAPQSLNDRGGQISQERLDYLAEKKAAILKAEEARTEKAAQAARALGFDFESLTIEDFLDPNIGWRLRSAISIAKSTKRDKILEYRYMSILSGIKTHVRNTAGNAIQLVMEGPVQKLTEGVVNLGVRNADSATISETGAWMQGFASAIIPAFKNMVNAYRTEGPAWELDLQRRGVEMGEYGSKIEGLRGPAIGGRAARGLRHLSLNTLQASDEFFKTLAGNAEAHSLAFREASNAGLTGRERRDEIQRILGDFKSDVWTKGLYKARASAFQDKGGEASQKALKLAYAFQGGLDELGESYLRTPVGTLLLSFVRTPIRVAATALRRTPLQSAMLPIKGLTGAYKGDKDALVRDLADAAIAWGLTLTAMELLQMEDEEGLPYITGSRPDSAKGRAIGYATAPPMSIRIFGRYYDYSGVEPLSTSLGMLVDAVQAWNDDSEDTDALASMFASAASLSKDKTFLRTFGDIMNLADSQRSGTDRTAGFVRDTLITPMVPNIIRQTARESDSNLRARRKLSDGVAAFWTDGIFATSADPIAKGLGAETRAARYDAWGTPITRPMSRMPGTDLVYRLLMPTPVWQEVDDIHSLSLALRTFDRKVKSGEYPDEKTYWPGQMKSTLRVDDEDVDLTTSEYEYYQREAGQRAATRLLEMSNSGGLNLDDPTPEDISVIRKEVNRSRRAIRGELVKSVRARLKRVQ